MTTTQPDPRVRKATHGQTRSYNSRLVLRTIYDEGPISRADVARLTSLTRTSVSDLVAELLEQSLVEETGRGPSTGGKAPILVRFVADSRLIVAVDIAETELRGALVDLRGEIRRRATCDTTGLDGKQTLDVLHELLDGLIAAAGKPLVGIGIATPGLIDPSGGIVRRAVHLDWRDLPLGRRLQDRYDLPTHVVNDSHASALAEYMYGDHPHDANLVVVRAGRGVGAGLILKGQLFVGDGGGAGEIGHTRVAAARDEPCRCGRTGCLETIAGSRAVLDRARRDAVERRSPALAAFADDPERLGLEELRGLADLGDDLAASHIERAGRAMGAALGALIGALDVEELVIVGPMTRLGDRWLDAVRLEAITDALPALSSRARIVAAATQPDQVVLGASALLLTRELGLSLAR
jgi:predicted NBD/HSP70 family sugar kinase